MGRIGGIATTSVFIITALAPLMGWLVHKKKWPIPPLYVLAAVICVTSIVVGFRFPVTLTEGAWRYVMSIYVFVACWIPVWLLLQPRDFVNVQILYGGLLLMLVGTVWSGLSGVALDGGLSGMAEGRNSPVRSGRSCSSRWLAVRSAAFTASRRPEPR